MKSSLYILYLLNLLLIISIMTCKQSKRFLAFFSANTANGEQREGWPYYCEGSSTKGLCWVRYSKAEGDGRVGTNLWIQCSCLEREREITSQWCLCCCGQDHGIHDHIYQTACPFSGYSDCYLSAEICNYLEKRSKLWWKFQCRDAKADLYRLDMERTSGGYLDHTSSKYFWRLLWQVQKMAEVWESCRCELPGMSNFFECAVSAMCRQYTKVAANSRKVLLGRHQEIFKTSWCEQFTIDNHLSLREQLDIFKTTMRKSSQQSTIVSAATHSSASACVWLAQENKQVTSLTFWTKHIRRQDVGIAQNIFKQGNVITSFVQSI